jgi:hypothetical protein
MSGNTKKWARNKRRGPRNTAESSPLVADATDLEEASYAVNRINYLKKRDRREHRIRQHEIEEKKKITLPKITFGQRDW